MFPRSKMPIAFVTPSHTRAWSNPSPNYRGEVSVSRLPRESRVHWPRISLASFVCLRDPGAGKPVSVNTPSPFRRVLSTTPGALSVAAFDTLARRKSARFGVSESGIAPFESDKRGHGTGPNWTSRGVNRCQLCAARVTCHRCREPEVSGERSKRGGQCCQ